MNNCAKSATTSLESYHDDKNAPLNFKGATTSKVENITEHNDTDWVLSELFKNCKLQRTIKLLVNMCIQVTGKLLN